jgi:hypothetical protein
MSVLRHHGYDRNPLLIDSNHARESFFAQELMMCLFYVRLSRVTNYSII